MVSCVQFWAIVHGLGCTWVYFFDYGDVWAAEIRLLRISSSPGPLVEGSMVIGANWILRYVIAVGVRM